MDVNRAFPASPRLERAEAGTRPRVLLVANRLPYSIAREKDGWTWKENAGGVAVGLRSVVRQVDCLWIGAAPQPLEDISEGIRDLERLFLERFNCAAIFLKRAEHDGYYRDFSNGVLWPAFHGFGMAETFDVARWRHYRRVNQYFLDKVLEHLRPGDVVWINDYHLLLLPMMLRARTDGVRIGFVVHTAFPEKEIFERVPFHEELIRGLLGADIIGVYTDRYRSRLEQCIDAGLEKLKTSSETLQALPRRPQVGVYPIGIDPNLIDGIISGESAKALIDALRREFRGLKIVLSADRLDYTKGILEKLQAFELFLQRCPAFKEKVVLIACVAPSRLELRAYNALNSEIRRRIEQINERHGTRTWRPIRLINRVLPYDELLCYYKIADVSLVTPFEDGMNLMAKEFLYVKGAEGGMLVLSERAGAAVELDGAYRVDPREPDQIADGIVAGLTGDIAAIIERNKPMVEHLRSQTVGKWAAEFISRLQSLP
jgi:trehalose 6-phosphate synthase/phosphatase